MGIRHRDWHQLVGRRIEPVRHELQHPRPVGTRGLGPLFGRGGGRRHQAIDGDTSVSGGAWTSSVVTFMLFSFIHTGCRNNRR